MAGILDSRKLSASRAVYYCLCPRRPWQGRYMYLYIGAIRGIVAPARTVCKASPFSLHVCPACS